MERLDCLDREEAEALVVTMRRKLAEAKLMEEEVSMILGDAPVCANGVLTLHAAQVIGLRLHTGPAFMKLNETLRERDVGKGNKYVATIYAVVSEMTKLPGISGIPEGRLRSSGRRMRMEQAFLSTTTDLNVAMHYAAERALPTMFAIQAGAEDKGAVIGFLSQYPDENEILLCSRRRQSERRELRWRGADACVACADATAEFPRGDTRAYAVSAAARCGSADPCEARREPAVPRAGLAAREPQDDARVDAGARPERDQPRRHSEAGDR
eukprot:1302057-Rhodomonas_salina.1